LSCCAFEDFFTQLNHSKIMMKQQLAVMLWVCLSLNMSGQVKSPVDQAVEGSRVLVELIRAFSSDKERDKAENSECKGRYADLCITNDRDSSLTVVITHRTTNELRELVITPAGKECSLQLPVGVWTYDLRHGSSVAPMRKGDLLVEGCNHLAMTIK
jgi:hypothetical protein